MVDGRGTEAKIPVLRYGMVGGGEGAFIGEVHRKAAAFDRKSVLVAGAFSRDFENSLRTGKQLGLSRDRIYETFEEMAQKEAQREDRIDYVVIVTPNAIHYPAAKAFLQRGFHVVCDKPLTLTVEESRELKELAENKKLLFGVTYTYSGYPMVIQAREMIKNGLIGDIRMVMAEYPQEWLAESVEKSNNKQASWRTDPKLSGIANCLGDIGTHIENTVSRITGLQIEYLCCSLDSFGEGRVLDDNVTVNIRYRGGARGLYWASQIAIGSENGLRIRVYGTKGSLEWAQEDPNYLTVTFLNGPQQRFTRGSVYLSPKASKWCRIPAGHPEGYFEAFANIYSAFGEALLKHKRGQILTNEDLDFPDVEDGLQGVIFVHRCVESAKQGGIWLTLESKEESE